MNWGKKLVIGMLLFMSFIIVLAVKIMQSDPDALVENDYYEQGLNYDEVYARKAQVFKDSAVPEISIVETELVISFRSVARGKVKFMRLSNQTMDRSLGFSTDRQHRAYIPLTKLAGGQWKLIADWKNAEGTSYLYEKEVIIP